MNLETSITLLAALSALVLGIWREVNGYKKSTADTTAVNVDTFRDLVQDVTKLKEENVSIQNQITDMSKKNSALWSYVYALLDFIRHKKFIPPDPPIELETDPKLMKIIGLSMEQNDQREDPSSSAK